MEEDLVKVNVAAIVDDMHGRLLFYVFGDLSSRTNTYSNWRCELLNKKAMNETDVVELILANLDDGCKVSVDSRVVNLDPRLVARSVAEELLDDSDRKLRIFTNEVF